jgi:23S rRNA pseudouridine2605 synthase
MSAKSRGGGSGPRRGGRSSGGGGGGSSGGPGRGGGGRAGGGEGRGRGAGSRGAAPAGRGRPGRGAAKQVPSEELRLQAYLARAGVASRRASEEIIRAGRVRVNGTVAELGSRVTVGRDSVTVDGDLVRLQPFEWLMLHKPRGYVTTRDDPEGRRTVYDLLPPELHHLFHVGRLDRDSTGIILLTNEGETANRLLHPRYGTTKEYLADVEGEVSDESLARLVEGVSLEDGVAQAIEVELLGAAAAGGSKIRVVLEEGRNREIRRMLEAIGHPVRSLYRRRFGPLAMGRLKRGEWRRLTDQEVQQLRQEHTT